MGLSDLLENFSINIKTNNGPISPENSIIYLLKSIKHKELAHNLYLL
jgi:hypothetical protein